MNGGLLIQHRVAALLTQTRVVVTKMKANSPPAREKAEPSNARRILQCGGALLNYGTGATATDLTLS